MTHLSDAVPEAVYGHFCGISLGAGGIPYGPWNLPQYGIQYQVLVGSIVDEGSKVRCYKDSSSFRWTKAILRYSKDCLLYRYTRKIMQDIYMTHHRRTAEDILFELSCQWLS